MNRIENNFRRRFKKRMKLMQKELINKDLVLLLSLTKKKDGAEK